VKSESITIGGKMLGPLSTAIVAKEAAEKAAMVIKESLKVLEKVKEGIEHLKINEFNKMKELYRNPSDITKEHFKYLFEEIKSAESNPDLRASLMNRLYTEPNLIGQMGEYHAELNLSNYGSFERQKLIATEKGTFRVDFAGKLTKDMPVQSYIMQDGSLKSISEVIPANQEIGVEVKNGLYELRQNFEHVINQALAAKEKTGNGFIGINQSMLETIKKNPEHYTDLFSKAAEYDIKIIVTQPGIHQQIYNIIS